MAKSDGYSFVNSYLIPLPLTGLDTPVGIEYDHRTNKIYWTDEVKHTVNRAALNGSFQEVIVQVADNFSREISISYTGWPRKNETAHFPQYVMQQLISVYGVISPEKNNTKIGNFGSVVCLLEHIL